MPYRYSSTDLTAARALGWLSVGLGLTDFFGRRKVAKLTGIHNAPLIGATGAREIVTGLGIIMARDPSPWIWLRVAGDAFDLGTLSSGVTPQNPKRKGSLIGLLMVVGIAAVDVTIAGRLHASAERQAQQSV
jgi:hypothetical protein